MQASCLGHFVDEYRRTWTAARVARLYTGTMWIELSMRAFGKFGPPNPRALLDDAKCVIVMEALCSQAPALGARIPKYIGALPGRFLPKILEYLSTSHNVSGELAQQICNSNSRGNLNRVPFRALLPARLEQLEIRLCNAAERIRTFTEIRNKIVHDFNYLTTDEFAESGLSPMNSTQQHFLGCELRG
jgi:hypothetical protein